MDRTGQTRPGVLVAGGAGSGGRPGTRFSMGHLLEALVAIGASQFQVDRALEGTQAQAGLARFLALVAVRAGLSPGRAGDGKRKDCE